MIIKNNRKILPGKWWCDVKWRERDVCAQISNSKTLKKSVGYDHHYSGWFFNDFSSRVCLTFLCVICTVLVNKHHSHIRDTSNTLCTPQSTQWHSRSCFIHSFPIFCRMEQLSTSYNVHTFISIVRDNVLVARERGMERKRKREREKAKEEHRHVKSVVREKRIAIHQPHRFHYYQPSCITNIYSLRL